jgi:trans-2-enoyl-CoA reductase
MLGRPHPSLCALPRTKRVFGAWLPSPLSQQTVRRRSGPYGYTQAKALVFSKTGEPSDVLKWVLLNLL